jgi:hypothetical protein
MRIACMHCRAEREVPEGADVARSACPACGRPQETGFPHAKWVRFEASVPEAVERAAEHARKGEREEALAALEAAMAAGYDDRERIGADPVFRSLRDEPRFRRLMKR